MFSQQNNIKETKRSRAFPFLKEALSLSNSFTTQYIVNAEKIEGEEEGEGEGRIGESITAEQPSKNREKKGDRKQRKWSFGGAGHMKQ